MSKQTRVEKLTRLMNEGKVNEEVLRWFLDGGHITLKEYIKVMEGYQVPVTQAGSVWSQFTPFTYTPGGVVTTTTGYSQVAVKDDNKIHSQEQEQ